MSSGLQTLIRLSLITTNEQETSAIVSFFERVDFVVPMRLNR